MYFTEVELKNFRNYKEQSVEFHPKVNIICGDNAQGKTNLLESLYIMSLGKSFRTNKDVEMIGFQQCFSSVKSSFIKNDTQRSIEIILLQEGKKVLIDGYRAKKSNELLENNALIVAFTPEDMKIVKDEPERRRRFIDRELSMMKPVYYGNLSRYKKILMQRNHLLKDDVYDEDLMEVWEKELAEYGSRIIIDRNNFIKKIKEISRKVHDEITEGREEIELYYEASIPFYENIDEIKEDFIERLKKERNNDLKRRVTGSGPHRDDLKITVNGVDVRSYGSQGQQRTAALSLKMAEINILKEEKNESPVLLLDDVLSELDEKRQEFLLKSLSNVQLFITTAEMKEALISTLKEREVFNVEKGVCVQGVQAAGAGIKNV